MMSAYFPEFENINHTTVCEWIFELEAKLRNEDKSDDKNNDISLVELSLPEILPRVKPRSVTI